MSDVGICLRVFLPPHCRLLKFPRPISLVADWRIGAQYRQTT